MDVMKAIYHRRAVRRYTGQEVTRELIENLIGDAVQAPSAFNAQPWSFAATTDAALLRHIAAQVRRHLVDSAGADSQLLRLMPELLDESFDVFYGAPALVVICATEDGEWIAEECGMAAQNLMLAACVQKLGSCCIGLARGWLEQPASKQLLGIPADYRPVLPIVLGHPYGEQRATMPRRTPDIHWMPSRPDAGA